MYIIRVNDESNNGSGGSNEKELVIKPNKNQEEKNVSEVPPLSNSGKRKRRGNNIVTNLSLVNLLITIILIFKSCRLMGAGRK